MRRPNSSARTAGMTGEFPRPTRNFRRQCDRGYRTSLRALLSPECRRLLDGVHGAARASRLDRKTTDCNNRRVVMTPRFTTLNNTADPTFNQLLALNNDGVIAGYFGSGAPGHPNKGYTLAPPYGQGSYLNENFPGSVQTQVTGINNHNLTVGFWVDGSGNNFGFVDHNGVFTTAVDPNAAAAGGTITEQFLGVNDHNQAAGFYVDGQGNSHGFIYDISKSSFDAINVSGFSSVTATDINDKGQISGFVANNGVSEGFFDNHGKITLLAGPNGAVSSQALGLNNKGEVVGSFNDAAGNTHGFVYDVKTHHYQTIDDPNAAGMTVVNGINDKNQLVGFYQDAAGNTDGMLVQLPQHHGFC
jgi:probable HAF family extracellular repeat protein